MLRLGYLPEIFRCAKAWQKRTRPYDTVSRDKYRVGAPLKLRSRTFQDDTAILLSTEVAGYEFGEWLHVCRLQAPLPDRVPPRKVTISLQENRDLPHSVTGTFGVHRMDLVLHFGKEEMCCLV